MNLVDSHQHFWSLQRGDYAWLTRDLGVLHRDHLPTDLEPELRRHGVATTVLVQAAASEAETRYLFDLARRNAFIAGVVGWCDLAAADAPQRIAALVREGDGKLKGLRPMLQDLADPGWVADRAVDAAFDAIVEHGLTFDALVRPAHYDALLARMRHHPQLRVVIDHCGKPDIAGNGYAAWADGIARLAGETQAVCKLSGLLTEARQGAGVDDIDPYARHVFERFGGHRVMWGSDWPVLNLTADYAIWLAMARDFVRRHAAPHEEAVFGGTAKAFYGLQEPHA